MSASHAQWPAAVICVHGRERPPTTRSIDARRTPVTRSARIGVKRRVRHTPAPGVEMRIALVGVTGREAQLASWEDPLQRAGLPCVSLALGEERHRRILLAEMRRTRFQALILADAGILEEVLDAAASRELERLERACRTRRLIACAYPTSAIGLRPSPWSGPLDGVAVYLTPRGKELFPYLRSELTIDAGSWGHPAWPLGSAQFEPLVTTADGAALIGIHRQDDGREQMVQTFATNPLQSHTHLLRPGQLSGSRAAFTSASSVTISRSMSTTCCCPIPPGTSPHTPPTTIRARASACPRATPRTRHAGRARVACVSTSSATELEQRAYARERPDGRDLLLETLLAERRCFGWINHTYGHLDLDEAPRAVIEAEIEHNFRWARECRDRPRTALGRHRGPQRAREPRRHAAAAGKSGARGGARRPAHPIHRLRRLTPVPCRSGEVASRPAHRFELARLWPSHGIRSACRSMPPPPDRCSIAWVGWTVATSRTRGRNSWPARPSGSFVWCSATTLALTTSTRAISCAMRWPGTSPGARRCGAVALSRILDRNVDRAASVRGGRRAPVEVASVADDGGRWPDHGVRRAKPGCESTIALMCPSRCRSPGPPSAAGTAPRARDGVSRSPGRPRSPWSIRRRAANPPAAGERPLDDSVDRASGPWSRCGGAR